MLDFDDIDAWGPMLSLVLSPVVGESTLSIVTASSPKFVEDARAQLLSAGPRDRIIDAVLEWLSSSAVAMYHGTRVKEAEESSIRAHGLRPLSAPSRGHRLERALSRHPKWPEVRDKLSSALSRFGRGNGAGGREGQVHFTLSRAGLCRGFNHYLTHGSEFDQHVAHSLLGQEGVELLANDGNPILIKVAIPGSEVIAGAHRYFSADDLRSKGDLPNVVRDFLQAWAYRLSHPTFQSETLRVDCGAVFRETIPASSVVSIERLILGSNVA